jgi:hypothetical protein
MAGDTPFGLAESASDEAPAQMPRVATEVDEAPAQMPRMGGSAPSSGPSNPFQSKSAKTAERTSEAPPFEMPKSEEGGFEMKGMSASEAPVGEIEAAPLGKEDTDDSPFASGDSKSVREATNPFGSSKGAPVVEKPAPGGMGDFGQMPESKAPAPMEGTGFPAVAPGEAPAGKPAPAAPVDSIKQLEVRAIFGVDRELSRSELIQRAKGLPGIKNLSVVSGEELRALETVQDCMCNLGFGQKEHILLTCPHGTIEFVSHGSSAMAIVRDGDWKPGVRETLIIITREIDKL